MKLPQEKEAYKLLRKFGTPPNVIEHSRQVARFGRDLALKFQQKGFKVDVQAVYLAGLLHDLLRVVDMREVKSKAPAHLQKLWEKQREKYAGWHHGDAAHQVLWKLGYRGLARLVERHKAEVIFEKKPFQSLEEQIIFYADKRVAHTQVVSLDERIREAKKRYCWQGAELRYVERGWAKMRELERELKRKLA